MRKRPGGGPAQGPYVARVMTGGGFIHLPVEKLGKMARLKQTQRKSVGSASRLPVEIIAAIAAEEDALSVKSYDYGRALGLRGLANGRWILEGLLPGLGMRSLSPLDFLFPKNYVRLDPYKKEPIVELIDVDTDGRERPHISNQVVPYPHRSGHTKDDRVWHREHKRAPPRGRFGNYGRGNQRNVRGMMGYQHGRAPYNGRRKGAPSTGEAHVFVPVASHSATSSGSRMHPHNRDGIRIQERLQNNYEIPRRGQEEPRTFNVNDLKRLLNHLEGGRVTATAQAPSPFSVVVREAQLPVGYRNMTNGLRFHGNFDPVEFLGRFNIEMDVYQVPDLAQCRILVATLREGAQQWFQKLGPGVITSWEQMKTLFLTQFQTAVKYTPPVTTEALPCPEVDAPPREEAPSGSAMVEALPCPEVEAPRSEDAPSKDGDLVKVDAPRYEDTPSKDGDLVEEDGPRCEDVPSKDGDLLEVDAPRCKDVPSKDGDLVEEDAPRCLEDAPSKNECPCQGKGKGLVLISGLSSLWACPRSGYCLKNSLLETVKEGDVCEKLKGLQGNSVLVFNGCPRLRSLELSYTLHPRAWDHLSCYLVGYPHSGDRAHSEQLSLEAEHGGASQNNEGSRLEYSDDVEPIVELIDVDTDGRERDDRVWHREHKRAPPRGRFGNYGRGYQRNVRGMIGYQHGRAPYNGRRKGAPSTGEAHVFVPVASHSATCSGSRMHPHNRDGVRIQERLQYTTSAASGRVAVRSTGTFNVNDLKRLHNHLEGGRVTATAQAPSPFSVVVREAQLPVGYRNMTDDLHFHGNFDPVEFLGRFNIKMDVYQVPDLAQCRILVATFREGAQQWFQKLGPGVITSWEQMKTLFLTQFQTAVKYTPPVTTEALPYPEVDALPREDAPSGSAMVEALPCPEVEAPRSEDVPSKDGDLVKVDAPRYEDTPSKDGDLVEEDAPRCEDVPSKDGDLLEVDAPRCKDVPSKDGDLVEEDAPRCLEDAPSKNECPCQGRYASCKGRLLWDEILEGKGKGLVLVLGLSSLWACPCSGYSLKNSLLETVKEGDVREKLKGLQGAHSEQLSLEAEHGGVSQNNEGSRLEYSDDVEPIVELIDVDTDGRERPHIGNQVVPHPHRSGRTKDDRVWHREHKRAPPRGRFGNYGRGYQRNVRGMMGYQHGRAPYNGRRKGAPSTGEAHVFVPVASHSATSSGSRMHPHNRDGVRIQERLQNNYEIPRRGQEEPRTFNVNDLKRLLNHLEGGRVTATAQAPSPFSVVVREAQLPVGYRNMTNDLRFHGNFDPVEFLGRFNIEMDVYQVPDLAQCRILVATFREVPNCGEVYATCYHRFNAESTLVRGATDETLKILLIASVRVGRDFWKNLQGKDLVLLADVLAHAESFKAIERSLTEAKKNYNTNNSKGRIKIRDRINIVEEAMVEHEGDVVQREVNRESLEGRSQYFQIFKNPPEVDAPPREDAPL
ncbi:hypothetical protein AgCh_039051 [Apium graveolens]